MSRRATVFALVIAGGLWWGVGTGRAGQDANLARGFSAEKLYDYSGIDSVNLYNGALGLTLPIGPRYPVGDQLSYGLTLSYSSNVWDPNLRGIGPEGPGGTDRLMVPRRSSNAGLGWMISLGGDLYGPAHPSEPPTPSAFFQFESEDGSIHVFHQSLHTDDNQQPEPCEGGGALPAFTRDNTYLRLCGSLATKRIEFPDGTKRTYTRMPTPPSSAKRPWDLDRYRLTRIEDRFGNWVTVGYSSTGDKWTISDSLGRTHTVNFHLEPVDGERMWLLDSVDLKGFDGVTSRYEFVHEIEDIERSCKKNEGAPPNQRIDVPLLRTVRLPADESGFPMSFEMPDYNTECTVGGGPKDSPGTIKALELPTGGRLEWKYTTYVFVTPDPEDPEDPVHDIVEEAAGVHTKKVLTQGGTCAGGGSCEWTYASTSLGNGNRRTVVTTPLGHRHVAYFREQRPHTDPNLPPFTGWDHGLPFTTDETEAGLYLSQEIYDGPVSEENLQRSVYVAYEHDQLYYASEIGIWSQLYLQSNRRVKAQRTLYHDDKDNGVPRFTGVDSDDFDGFGHYRSRVVFGILGGPGTHTAFTDYNPERYTYQIDQTTNDPGPNHDHSPWPVGAPWVLGTYTLMRVEEPGSAFVSQYCFDPSTGRLKRRRMLASAAGPGAHDVLVQSTRVFELLNEGQPNEMQAIHYEDFVYGGDLPDLNTGSALCDIPLPGTPIYRTRNTQIDGTLAITEPRRPDNGVPILRTLDLAIDRSTGLAKTSTDPAGLATDYDYDQLGRLLWIEPRAGGIAGGDAWTEIRYCAAGTNDPDCDVAGDPANVTVRRRANGNPNGTVFEESRFVYDPFGRVARDQRKVPSHGWTTVDTGYNALGWKKSVSERGPLGTATGKTQFKDYDPFGRPGSIELPDFPSDGRHWVKLTYAGDRTVTREVSIGSDLEGGETRSSTTELYDNFGRLRRVKEPSGPAGEVADTTYGYDAAGRLVSVEQQDVVDDFEQNRSFVYDGRGFLTSETHPENGTTEYSDYDPAGNAGRKTNGPQFDLAYVYDDAQRLIKVRRWSDNLLLKEFTYGTGTTGDNRSKGKIETAVRYNHVVHPQNGNPHTIKVTETYYYGGRGGRPSLRTTALSIGESAGPGFSQSWAYNQLGQVNLVNYPVCTHSGSTCSPGNEEHSRPVTFQHDLGYLTGVFGWADSISYHANGMLNEIHHANEVVYNQGLDPHWMRRPNSLGITHPLHQLTFAEGAALASDFFYTYDGAGNVKSWYDEEYRYDKVSRVLEGRDTNGQTQAYTYDVFGNIRTIITDRGGTPDPDPTTVELGVNRQTNQLSASAYDAAGNLVTRGPYVYGYDSFSMMKTMNGGGSNNTYIYTADDERIWTVDASDSPWKEIFTLRDLDGKVLRVFTTADDLDFATPTDDLDELAWSQDYIYRNGQLLATARTAGENPETYHHFHLNHLGTPLLITGGDGTHEALHSYFPFGEEIDPDEDTERMKYTGHERDFNQEGETDDLDYMHARYCAPLLGRFLTVDKAGVTQPKRPQSWNRYTYALNNPLFIVDPDGNIGVGCDACGARFDDPNLAMGDLPDRLRSETPHQRNVRYALTMPFAAVFTGSMARVAPSAVATLFPRATTVALTPEVQAAATGIAAGLADQPSPAALLRVTLARSAAAAGDDGVSAITRAIQKHSSREGTAYGPVSGNLAARNAAGRALVDEILGNPNTTFNQRTTGRFGEVLDVVAPDGRGLRYSVSGEFIGLLEPPR